MMGAGIVTGGKVIRGLPSDCTVDHKPHYPIAYANHFVSSSIPQV